MVDKFIITYKCEHAVIGKDGVLRCPFRDKQKKWIRNNIFIKEKVTFPVCPKRMEMKGQPIICAKYELPALKKPTKKKAKRC